MSELDKVKNLLSKYNLSPKKSFGQNFLIDEGVINNIINLFDYSKYLEVVEIGPGLGALTSRLVNKTKQLKVIDADKDMVFVLKDLFHDKENISIIQSDFLKINFDAKTTCTQLAIGNLPYNITSLLIEYLLKNNFSTIGIMVQKEVGEKLNYIPGKRENTPLGLFLACGYKISNQIFAPSSSFFPEPKVDSLFLKIEKVREIKYDYYLIFKIMFKDNNKTIRNCLKQNIKTKKYALDLHSSEIENLLLNRARQLDASSAIKLAEEILINISN